MTDTPAKTTPTIAVIPGDGIGPEVIAQARLALDALTDGWNFVEYDLGAARWQRTGEVLPDSVLEELSGADAILFGAVGAAPGSKTIPSGLLERELLLKLRFNFDQGINLRPTKLYSGVTSPLSDAVLNRGPIDFVVVREGTEGLYCGIGGIMAKNTPQEIATEVSQNTFRGTERAVRYAFEAAMRRNKRRDFQHNSFMRKSIIKGDYNYVDKCKI
jgi:3-isopropylmalate dehydrogenase